MAEEIKETNASVEPQQEDFFKKSANLIYSARLSARENNKVLPPEFNSIANTVYKSHEAGKPVSEKQYQALHNIAKGFRVFEKSKAWSNNKDSKKVSKEKDVEPER